MDVEKRLVQATAESFAEDWPGYDEKAFAASLIDELGLSAQAAESTDTPDAGRPVRPARPGRHLRAGERKPSASAER